MKGKIRSHRKKGNLEKTEKYIEEIQNYYLQINKRR